MAEGGKAFVEMYRKGRVPTSAQDTSYWQYMFEYAKVEKDAKLFAELLEDLKKRKADDRRLRRYLDMLEKQLAEIQKGDG